MREPSLESTRRVRTGETLVREAAVVYQIWVVGSSNRL